MDLPTPTMDEFQRLYDAAMAFKQQAPWEWLFEDQILGIRDPETGQIGYASIMGHLGEHLALALYLGAEGLDGFRRMARGEGKENPTVVLEVPHLQASFEDRNTLHAKDREVIKALGLRFRGRQAWPMFRSYVPGCAPWFVTPEEARFLTVALEQTWDVVRRLHEAPDLLNPRQDGQYLVRIQTEQGWVDGWLSPEPTPMRPPPAVDTQRLAALRRELPRQRFTLEADLFPMPTYVKDDDTPRPYLPYTLMVVETSSGFILGTQLMIAKPSLDAVWEQTTARFLDTLTQWGSLPHRVAVRDKRLYSLLVPIAAGLGIQLKRSRRLRALDEARAALALWWG